MFDFVIFLSLTFFIVVKMIFATIKPPNPKVNHFFITYRGIGWSISQSLAQAYGATTKSTPNANNATAFEVRYWSVNNFKNPINKMVVKSFNVIA